jgi:hypothetical protein
VIDTPSVPSDIADADRVAMAPNAVAAREFHTALESGAFAAVLAHDSGVSLAMPR